MLHYLEGQPLHWKDLEEGCDLAEVPSQPSLHTPHPPYHQ